jgi:threonine dehydrogenase-like Zn-dependent dehydrogenase
VGLVTGLRRGVAGRASAEGHVQVGDGVEHGDSGERLRDLIIELSLDQAPAAYDKFDKRADGYTKVLLHPSA